MLNTDRSTKICPDCNGNRDCDRCEGSGEVRNPGDELGEGIANLAVGMFSGFTVDPIEFDHTCPVCKGNKQCQRCGGTGEVIDRDAEEDEGDSEDDSSSNGDESYTSDYDSNDNDDYNSSSSNYSPQEVNVRNDEEDDEIYFHRIAWLESNGQIENCFGYLAIGDDRSLYVIYRILNVGFKVIHATTLIKEYPITNTIGWLDILFKCNFYTPSDNKTLVETVGYYLSQYDNDKIKFVSVWDLFGDNHKDTRSDKYEHNVEWQFLND